MKTMLWKPFFFFAGAILFMAFISPISQQLFVYATGFATFPDGYTQADPTLPYQYIAFTPFLALLAGAVVGSLWACILLRIPEKSAKVLPSQARTIFWYALGGFLLAIPVLLILFSRVAMWLFDIFPPNTYIFVALFWLLSVACFFLRLMREKSITEKAEVKKKNRWLPLWMFGVLTMCVLLCMLLKIYPISFSLDFLIQKKELTDIIPEEISLARQLVYWGQGATWIHQIVVAGCAFILGGWQTACLRISPKSNDEFF